MTKQVAIFVVGGAKCGTTWLHHVLKQRVDISLPEQKETNYFSFLNESVEFSGPLDKENINKNTIKSLSQYVALFDNRKPVWAEISPSYLFVEAAAKNIYAHNPKAKIVIILRNPAERAWSNYLHLVRDGAEEGSFANALALEKSRLANGWSWFWAIYEQGLYADQVERYYEVFGRDSVSVMIFEDMIKAPKLFMRNFEKFTGLPEFDYEFKAEKNESGLPKKNWAIVHRSLYAPNGLNALIRGVLPVKLRKRLSHLFKRAAVKKEKMAASDRRMLMDSYQEDLSRLSKLTGLSLDSWRGDESKD